MPNGWQVQTPRVIGELVLRVWGNGSARPCVLKGETSELTIDVVEVRLVPPHFERGRLVPAHGSMTIDVRSDDARRGLQELARSRAVVVFLRPDGGALEMRLGVPSTITTAKVGDASPKGSAVTYSWDSP